MESRFITVQTVSSMQWSPLVAMGWGLGLLGVTGLAGWAAGAVGRKSGIRNPQFGFFLIHARYLGVGGVCFTII